MSSKKISELAGEEAVKAPSLAEAQDERDVLIANLSRQVENLTSLVLKSGMGSDVEDAKRADEHTCRVVFYKDLPVVEIGSVFTAHTDEGDIETLPIKYLEGSNQVDENVNYVNFYREAPRYLAVVVDKKSEVKTKHQGARPIKHVTTNPKPVDEDGRPTAFSPREIVLSEKYQVLTYKVRLVEGPMKGQELTLDSHVINFL